MRKIKLPSEYTKSANIWTSEEARRFFEIARTSSIWPAIYTALTSGLRQGELCALRWQDLEKLGFVVGGVQRTFLKINVNHTLVIVPKKDHEAARFNNMEQVTGSYFLDKPKTIKSQGHVLVAEDTLKLLAEVRKNQLELAKDGRYQNLGFVFASKYGTPRHPNKLYQTFITLEEQADVPRITFHELRDSHLSRLQGMNVDLATTSSWTRHSRKSTTADKYIPTLTANELNAVKALPELFELEAT